MDALTESTHHSKHHQTYVTKLNEALATNAERPACYQQYSGGHYSHSVYWQNMASVVSSGPTCPLKDLIDRSFGSFDTVKDQFSQAAIIPFASD